MEKVQGAACVAGVETLPAAMDLERQPGRNRRDTLKQNRGDLNPSLTKKLPYGMREWGPPGEVGQADQHPLSQHTLLVLERDD